jgi:hexosaminidase
MRAINYIIALIALFTAFNVNAVETTGYDVVPLPQNITMTADKPFALDASVVITYRGTRAMQRNARFLALYINEITGLQLKVAKNAKNAKAIKLTADLKDSNEEAYKMTVNADGITIDGASDAGTFHGIQTLRKAIPANATQLKYFSHKFSKSNIDQVDSNAIGSVTLPAATIYDYPRFAYRGMMLDCGRHYFNVDDVETFIDMLALHNVNEFHWHLSEDQGWRAEIKKYPRLTKVGAWRAKADLTTPDAPPDQHPYGGFYTQRQIRDIVKYAAERYIEVVPEIDMPGHMGAALASYPNLGCTGGPYKVQSTWGVFPDVLCAGNDDTYKFIKDVLNEIMDIFPSRYIHIGGDECPKARWEKCAKCQARIKALGIKSDSVNSAETLLQTRITYYARKIVSARGRRLIGWDEITKGDYSKSLIVMSRWDGKWRNNAVKHGNDVILAHYPHCYFDYYQSRDKANEPKAIGGYTPVDSAYLYYPLHASDQNDKQILGVEGELWTEFIATLSHAQYMTLPRLDALSEVQWNASSERDFAKFKSRLSRMLKFYDKKGWNYAKHILNTKQ